VIDIEDADPLGALAAGLPAPPPTAAPQPSGGSTAGVASLPATAQPGPARVLVARAPQARDVGVRALKVIVIDAGHGGHDPGARSLVRNEKDITLAAALALKARLGAMGRYRVVLTRDSDVFIPLESRVQIARRAGADLFISLHADSAGADPTPHGASVYTLSDHGQTRVNNVLGPHEWFAHAGGARSEPGVGQILLDLAQRSTRNRSSRFAGLLIEHIGQRVDLLPRTHRDAGYFVLLAPDVPAVLLEMGFITNPGDELRLTDPAQRDALMAGVADAIDSYFAGDSRLSAG
jgi:N-acetylmuramoyl-L-alanine amidase